MTYEMISALAAFAFVSSITPGPNNLMLMASGANYGFRRTVPHMLGVGIGFTVMIVLVGIGMIRIFDLVPYAHEALIVASVVYLCWLAWRIAHAAAPQQGDLAGAQPMTFFQAAAFQWVNPKAWTMALSAVTLYAPGRSLTAILIVAAVFGVVNLPSVSVWTVLGLRLRALLTSQGRLTLFNWTMAALLLGSVWPVLKPYFT